MVTAPVLLETSPAGAYVPEKSCSALLLEARYRTDGKDAIGGPGPENCLLTELMRMALWRRRCLFQALKAGPVSPQSDLPRERDRTREEGCAGRSTDRTANSPRRSNFVAPSGVCWLGEKVSALVCSSASAPRALQREDPRSELWQAGGSSGTVLWSLHFYAYSIFIARDAVSLILMTGI